MGALFRDFEELRDYSQDVLRASYDEFDGALARFLSVLDADRAAGKLVRELLPQVDFPTWLARVQSTVTVVEGSGTLTFPTDAPERLALQLELMRRMVAGDVKSFAFASDFGSGAARYDDRVRKLAEKLVFPFQRDLTRLCTDALERDISEGAPTPPVIEGAVVPAFVAPARIEELRAMTSGTFDTTRLVRLCEEVNASWRTGSLMAVAALTRAILDHVPPLFGATAFAQVASGGGRSFSSLMTRLDRSARTIADAYLHQQIRSRESLPTAQQVNFSAELDALLAEIIRRHSRSATQ